MGGVSFPTLWQHRPSLLVILMPVISKRVGRQKVREHCQTGHLGQIEREIAESLGLAAGGC